MTGRINDVAERLAKLIPRLASDHDGEIVATARAIGRTLSGVGLDFHDFAKVIEFPVLQKSFVSPSQPTPTQKPWAVMAQWCQTHSDNLNDKEKGFIRDMMARYNEPTEKQATWLRAIFARLKTMHP